jgi:hypothetical protein
MKIQNLYSAACVAASFVIFQLGHVSCYQAVPVVNRRQLLNAAVALPVVLTADTKDAKAVISSKYCAYGEGDGCGDLAEGNPFILELQQRSSANKVAIQTVGHLRRRRFLSSLSLYYW